MTRDQVRAATEAIHAAACGCHRTPARCGPQWRAAATAADQATRDARPTRRRHVPEPVEYVEMIRRMVRAAGRRVSVADPEHLAALVAVRRDLDAAIVTAVAGVRRSGFSWQSIGEATGTTKQSAVQKWGAAVAAMDSPATSGQPCHADAMEQAA
jgi:hypothetical protein